MMRGILVAAFCFLAGPALAQQGIGQIPPWAVVGNPSAATAPPRDTAISQILSGSKALVSIDAYGAAHDGVTNDTAALSGAAAALGAAGGYIQLTCGYSYLFATNYTIPASVILRHCSPGIGNPGVDWASSPYTQQGHINLSATLTLSSTSGILDAVILNPACTYPVIGAVSCYGGTALAFASAANDVVIKSLIVGYKTCFDGTPGGNRLALTIYCDNQGTVATDAGIVIGPSADRGVFNLATYPYGNVASGVASNSPLLTRVGIGTHQLSGLSDGELFVSLFDFGHATGVRLDGNGNSNYQWVWTDNNATWGVFNNTDRSSFGQVWVYSSPGFYQASNGDLHIDFLLCDSGGVTATVNCLEVAGLSSISINYWRIVKATGFGLFLDLNTSNVQIGNLDWSGVHGGVGPYIVGPSNWTTNQVRIGAIKTDLVAGSSLFGGSVLNYVTAASAPTVPLPVNSDLVQITGTSAINNFTGVWGGRQVTLEFASTASVQDTAVGGGNIKLQGGGAFAAVAGSVLVLLFDQPGALWREVSRTTPNVGIPNGATVAPGAATCPTGTVGTKTVVGCIFMNVGGVTQFIPFF